MAKANKKDLDRKAIRILIICGLFIVALFVMYGLASRQLLPIETPATNRGFPPYRATPASSTMTP